MSGVAEKQYIAVPLDAGGVGDHPGPGRVGSLDQIDGEVSELCNASAPDQFAFLILGRSGEIGVGTGNEVQHFRSGVRVVRHKFKSVRVAFLCAAGQTAELVGVAEILGFMVPGGQVEFSEAGRGIGGVVDEQFGVRQALFPRQGEHGHGGAIGGCDDVDAVVIGLFQYGIVAE